MAALESGKCQALSGRTSVEISPVPLREVRRVPFEVERSLSEAELVTVLDERCAQLGKVPLQFLRWNPSLIDLATPRTKARLFYVLKRFIDITGSLTLGLVLLPFLPALIWLIRHDSPGSALYSQVRLGKSGKPFRIYKFRTMVINAEAAGAVFAIHQDPRVTTVGRFLRKTRIDEFPQLWNVLKGEMTLVGPRPERPEHIARIEAQVPEFSLRTLVKPGITGWAQVSRPYAVTIDELSDKLEYDLYYIKFASLGMEMLILFRTLKVIVGLKGQ